MSVTDDDSVYISGLSYSQKIDIYDANGKTNPSVSYQMTGDSG